MESQEVYEWSQKNETLKAFLFCHDYLEDIAWLPVSLE